LNVKHVKSILTNSVSYISLIVKSLFPEEIRRLHQPGIIKLPYIRLIGVEGRLSINHQGPVPILDMLTLLLHQRFSTGEHHLVPADDADKAEGDQNQEGDEIGLGLEFGRERGLN
jgi:hypothetical protein